MDTPTLYAAAALASPLGVLALLAAATPFLARRAQRRRAARYAPVPVAVAADYEAPRTWPENTHPEPRRFGTWLAACGTDVRTDVVTRLLEQADIGVGCLEKNHHLRLAKYDAAASLAAHRADAEAARADRDPALP